jgi:hypothetical protein
LAQELQLPPPEGVNFPPLLAPNTENFFRTFFAPHPGQATAAAPPVTSFSNSCPQRQQQNSKIGTAAPSAGRLRDRSRVGLELLDAGVGIENDLHLVPAAPSRLRSCRQAPR